MIVVSLLISMSHSLCISVVCYFKAVIVDFRTSVGEVSTNEMSY